MDTSLTYGQLLALPQWQEKRLTIIKRDNLICQKCSNKSYEKDNKYGPFFKISAEKRPYCSIISFNGIKEDVYTEDLNGTKLIPKKGTVMLYYSRHRNSGISDIPEEGFYVSAARQLSENEINYYFPFKNPVLTPQEECSIYIEWADMEKAGKVIPENKGLHESLNDFRWIFAKDLNVHHTYYQIDKLPWEYPDESLQTLCRSCHERVHEEEIIPVIKAGGLKLGNYKPCTRCYGAGWFPEYSHVENGICFKCSGVKYLSDEFIIKD